MSRILHRDWVIDAEKSIHQTVGLLKVGMLPESIEVMMVVTPIRRALRGVYGGNFRAVWHLLVWSIKSGIRDAYWLRWRPFWHLTVLCKTQVEWEAMLDRECDELLGLEQEAKP